MKAESLDNELLRAFGRAITATYRSTNGREALDMLLRSGIVKQVSETGLKTCFADLFDQLWISDTCYCYSQCIVVYI